MAPLAPTRYEDSNDSPIDSGEALHTIEPDVVSTLAIGGRWLHFDLEVRLAGGECTALAGGPAVGPPTGSSGMAARLGFV